MPKKFSSPKTARALNLWHRVSVGALKDMTLDLSARQMAVLLHIYIAPPPHSIKTLAEQLSVSKPALCRAVDVLESAGLAKRAADRRDGRNIMIRPTGKGARYLSAFAGIILQASKKLS